MNYLLSKQKCPKIGIFDDIELGFNKEFEYEDQTHFIASELA